MARAPLIGISGRRIKFGQLDEYPKNFEHVRAHLYLEDYSSAIAEAGGTAINIPFDTDIETLAQHLDGILLSGGSDLNPRQYNEAPHATVVAVETERDTLEFELLEQAIQHGIPMLGICRGLQVLNVFQGGTLNQDVPAHSRYEQQTNATIHSVNLLGGSTLRSMYGTRHEVNSFHHQTVSKLGDGLTVTAIADDGEIEGLEMGDLFTAVQWHPELLPTRASDPLFSWLVKRSRNHRST